MYTKKAKSIPLIVKSSTTMDEKHAITTYDSDDEFERTKQISNKVLTKSAHVVIPPSMMTIVTTPDLSKKSARTDNVIIQQLDGNINSNSSTKLVKLVVPQSTISSSSSSIKMLSSGDGLASALRIPTKIQLTKTLYVPSARNDKTASLISSTSTHSINHEQQTFLPSSSSSSTTLLDIPIDMTEKQQQQQSRVDYHSSTTLPPTPPPPVIDNNNSNVRNVLSHTSNNHKEEQGKNNETPTIIIKAIGEVDSSTINHNPHHQVTSKRHSLHTDHTSSLVDWSVPPTSELSPTSLTSSSPDLAQNHLPLDDSLAEYDSTIHSKRSIKRRNRSLSSSCPILPSFMMSCLQSHETVLKPIKSKSLTGLSNSTVMKCMIINNKRSLTASPIMKLSSSQRIRKRRRDNENIILNQQNGKTYKSKTKHLKMEYDNHPIIKDLLNEIIEKIVSTSDDTNNSIKTLLNTSISPLKQPLPVSVLPTRHRKISYVEQTKTEIPPRTSSIDKKSYTSSHSLDSTVQNESRSMIMTSRELDELAYLLHANVHRGQFERIDNPTKVEEHQYDIYLWYFLNVYTRCDYKSSLQEERDLTEHCRLLSVRYTLIYITNNGIFLDSWNKTLKLLDILLIDTCPESLRTSFLHDIVKISYNQEPKMKVCEILVRTILYRLRQTCSQANIYINLLSLLLNLCECRNGNDRPVCTYLVTLNDWLPQVALHDGKSLQRMTLLSPIFYISCFAEDDIDLLVSQLEKINEQEQDDDDNSQDFSEYKEKQIRSTIQSQLYTARKLMHKIVLAFFSNISSRNAMLDYLQKFIQLNIKRTHLTVSIY
ncbi:unnamed protein product [Rotaria sp. Silwood2]|nr:unnamed protein product [Rotaria sp. Silwood2]